MSQSTKRRALIVISSARSLPLAAPRVPSSLSTGFFLVELAEILRCFEDDYEFIFATPDGRPPQLDINGMALAFHAIEKLGLRTLSTQFQLKVQRLELGEYRSRHADLVRRRESELQLLERHLGRLPVSDPLPASDKEAVAFRDELVGRLAVLPEHRFYSVDDLVRRHRDSGDTFSLADFDFMHAPGGHAPMVDFIGNPWLGELLNLLHENGVLISLICHAPVALACTEHRVDAEGKPVALAHSPFKGAALCVASKTGEKLALRMSYVRVPGRKTRLLYFVDDALRKAGFSIQGPLNPSAAHLVFDVKHRLLTGNGPQSIDREAHWLRSRFPKTQSSGGEGSARRGNLASAV